MRFRLAIAIGVCIAIPAKKNVKRDFVASGPVRGARKIPRRETGARETREGEREREREKITGSVRAGSVDTPQANNTAAQSDRRPTPTHPLPRWSPCHKERARTSSQDTERAHSHTHKSGDVSKGPAPHALARRPDHGRRSRSERPEHARTHRLLEARAAPLSQAATRWGRLVATATAHDRHHRA